MIKGTNRYDYNYSQCYILNCFYCVANGMNGKNYVVLVQKPKDELITKKDVAYKPCWRVECLNCGCAGPYAGDHYSEDNQPLCVKDWNDLQYKIARGYDS